MLIICNTDTYTHIYIYPYTNATVKCYLFFISLWRKVPSENSSQGSRESQCGPGLARPSFLLPRAACVHWALEFCLPLVCPSPLLTFSLRPGLLSGGPAFSFLSFFPTSPNLQCFFDHFLFILDFYLSLWFYVCHVFNQRTRSRPCPLEVKQTRFLKNKILKWVRYG